MKHLRQSAQIAMLVVSAFILLTNKASAHEYWLEPGKYRAAPSETNPIRLMFGENFSNGVSKPLQLERTAQFRIYGQARRYGNLLIGKTANSEPAAELRCEKEGTVLLTMERSPAQISFGTAKFRQYAAQEGHAISEQELPTTTKRVRETYTRYLKAVLQTGATTNKTPTKVTGQRYELVPQQNPYSPGLTNLTCKLLFDGKPAVLAKVTAVQRLDQKLSTVSVITDEAGKCTLPITQEGRWQIRSVKMIPVAVGDYQSFWASLTFGYD